MTGKELAAAMDTINANIRKANKWHARMLDLDAKQEAAEDAEEMALAAKYERWQDIAIEKRDEAYRDAKAMMRLLHGVGFWEIEEPYQSGKHYPEIEEIVPQAVWDSLGF